MTPKIKVVKNAETPEPRDILVVQVRYRTIDKTVCEIELPDDNQWKDLIDIRDLSIYHPDSQLIFFIRKG